MSNQPIKANAQTRQLIEEVKQKNHPHLNQALIAAEFAETKAFVKNAINLGKVKKFSKSTQLCFPENAKYNFLISICSDVWFEILNEAQREAYIDLLLSRCQVEYEPNTVVVNGKKKVVKDEYGRVEYTDQIKVDDEGLPVWKVLPLNVSVISNNIKRYGLWYEDLMELKNAIEESNEEN